MQPQRETQTDSLANIIQILQIGVRSGTLTVERGDGPTFEEGYLVFVNGRVVDARTKQHINWAAFNYLKTWGSCRFSFESGAPALPVAPPFATNGHSNGNAYGSGPLNGYAHIDSANHDSLAQYAGLSNRLPARSQAGEAALLRPDSTALSRTHRRLLLLINGQRSRDDLARLMARTSDEVRMLLDDLEQGGFIQT